MKLSETLKRTLLINWDAQSLTFKEAIAKVNSLNDYKLIAWQFNFDPKTPNLEKTVQIRGTWFVNENNVNTYCPNHYHKDGYYLPNLDLAFVRAKHIKELKLQVATPNQNKVAYAELNDDHPFVIHDDKLYRISPDLFPENSGYSYYKYQYHPSSPFNSNNVTEITVNKPATEIRKWFKAEWQQAIKETEIRHALQPYDLEVSHEKRREGENLLKEVRTPEDFIQVVRDHSELIAVFLHVYEDAFNTYKGSRYSTTAQLADYVQLKMKNMANARTPIEYPYLLLEE